jgi:hypothetical protein
MAAVILERAGVDDLILLDEIVEGNVLDVLKSRYLDEDIYTYIGTLMRNLFGLWLNPNSAEFSNTCGTLRRFQSEPICMILERLVFPAQF